MQTIISAPFFDGLKRVCGALHRSALPGLETEIEGRRLIPMQKP